MSCHRQVLHMLLDGQSSGMAKRSLKMILELLNKKDLKTWVRLDHSDAPLFLFFTYLRQIDLFKIILNKQI